MQSGPSTPFQLPFFMRAWKVHEYLNTCVLHTGSFPHGCASLLLHEVIPCNSIAFGEHLLNLQVEDFWQHLQTAE